MWGIPYDKPVRRITEYLDGLLPLLEGAPVNSEGCTATARGSLNIPDVAAPPVYLAALGPQMLQVAGARTAGTLTWMTGPKTLAEQTGPVLRAAAAQAGRPDGAVKVVAMLPVSVTDDVPTSRAAAAKLFAHYGNLPSYRAMLDLEGYDGPADAAIIGDEDAVSSRLDELRIAGVDEFVAAPFDSDLEATARTRALLRKLDAPR